MLRHTVSNSLKPSPLFYPQYVSTLSLLGRNNEERLVVLNTTALTMRPRKNLVPVKEKYCHGKAGRAEISSHIWEKIILVYKWQG